MAIESTRFIDLIGQTPLISLPLDTSQTTAKLMAKCEFLNPAKSLKDRIANHMINMAEASGQLQPGATIVCASSGNTGCSVAMQGHMRGYQVIVVTSTKCSQEKLNHINAYGAEIIIKDEADYMVYATELAEKKHYFDINQYDNPYNSDAYYQTLGPEIWQQTQGQISHFVMTGSTFGCITGTAKYLKQQNPKVKIILADPQNSNMYQHYYQGYRKNRQLTLGKMAPYIIEGAGKSQPTECLDFSLIDEVLQVSDRDAIDCCHQLALDEGLLVGGSSGLNVYAARQVAQKNDGLVVTILCDSGLKYLSKIYDPQFLKQHNIRR